MYIYIHFIKRKTSSVVKYFQKVSMFHSVYGLRQIFPPSARVYFNLQLFILKLNFPGLNQDSGVHGLWWCLTHRWTVSPGIKSTVFTVPANYLTFWFILQPVLCSTVAVLFIYLFMFSHSFLCLLLISV